MFSKLEADQGFTRRAEVIVFILLYLGIYEI